jgi:hypothetical protein
VPAKSGLEGRRGRRGLGRSCRGVCVSGVVRAVGREAVDPEQRAVADDVGLARGALYRIDQVRCEDGQESDRFVDVTADGG